MRRRVADAIDSIVMTLRFLLIRHKSLGIFDPLFALDDEHVGSVLALVHHPPGCRAVGKHIAKNPDGTSRKNRNLPPSVIAETIRRDWLAGGYDSDGSGNRKNAHQQQQQQAVVGRGYYITGKLNSTIYTDDCLFDGPDPDMPVRGLRKYLSAASHLFDAKQSSAELLSLELVQNEEGKGHGHDDNFSDGEVTGGSGGGKIVARWRIEGVLMLPWRPAVKPWTGKTTYHLNEEGLIHFHEEEWDISVLEAFVCTVWPELGQRIWGEWE